MRGAQETPSVRRWLAEATRAEHEKAHRIGNLSRLTDETLTEAEYHAALTVLARLFTAIEAHRRTLSVWPQFSLENVCRALRSDLCDAPVPAAKIDLATRAHVLGALYVVHGAGFGRMVIARSVKTALPHLRHRYVQMHMDPDTWRLLCAELERVTLTQRVRRELYLGAMRTFRLAQVTGCSISSGGFA